MDKTPLIHHAPAPHWVGNAFHVRSMFSYGQRNMNPDPFLLLDYAQPRHFPPSQERRGVGEHPHRGFETITIAYKGEVEHRDSSGGGGIIAAGDVQWMTAGAGIMHDEFFSDAYSTKRGRFRNGATVAEPAGARQNDASALPEHHG
ncbi:pirin domain-containing protein [Advenella kashmirensis WT001]|uniref:Pirin domain-containing protein n=1 Tax=Advenella kashmirensis (strain DSM 17095 / LMG 22695 / WT001) TaxID=1036672 RepID=I3UEW8_ADVKW|nr:pirin domain-containing protein [Advenella kashmirensis WT001]